MERLTERFHAKGDKPTILHHGHRWGPAFFPNKDGYKQYSVLLDKLAAYEDAEEQGRLVVLPCAVGEKVYYIGTQNYTQRAVFDTDIDDLLYPIVFRTYQFTFTESDIGKTVFLTRAEAEAVLSAKEQNKCKP